MRCRGAAVALLTLAIALAGCSTYAASRYVASADTGQALRAYRGTRTVAVGPFVATVPNQHEMKCREKGHFTTPDGETFEEFVRQAFVSEFTKADLYAIAKTIADATPACVQHYECVQWVRKDRPGCRARFQQILTPAQRSDAERRAAEWIAARPRSGLSKRRSSTT